MPTDLFGPVELFMISFPEERVPESFRTAVLDVLEGGAVTLLDLTVIRKQTDGGLELLELDVIGDQLELKDIQLSAQGLIGDEDVAQLAGGLPDSGTTLVLAIEHTWARRVVGAVFDAGATVLATERIPAEVVNEVAALAELDAAAGA